ncbi:hypothetical protein O181_105301 [Austropuccinia psidii MF-1]|uniref:Uncharacterized protein n=1 Tax=Austropuccinia psidii MF-1 TaxID=1389203 RepID=A0A9Q3JP85_9BASI|nr:hypothetical protein [Austropuccinia psidii MF-1]
MAHVRWHATIHEPGSFLFFSHKSLHFSRIRTLHMQILMPFQDPDSVHANPYSCTGSQKFKPLLLRGRLPTFQQFLPPVQAPNASHANPYACTGSQQFKQFLMLVQACNASHANPYACEGSQQFR